MKFIEIKKGWTKSNLLNCLIYAHCWDGATEFVSVLTGDLSHWLNIPFRRCTKWLIALSLCVALLKCFFVSAYWRSAKGLQKHERGRYLICQGTCSRGVWNCCCVQRFIRQSLGFNRTLKINKTGNVLQRWWCCRT